MLSGFWLFCALIIFLLLRFPVFIALILSGSLGYIWEVGLNPWWHWASFSPTNLVSQYHYAAIPLFLLMGQIASAGNITKDLFVFTDNIARKTRGGVAILTILSCGVFGSLCGSSLATAATMTPIAYKEMKSRNYSKELILGTLAAGGTLGVLVPPSIVLVIYSIIAEESIALLSIAAIVPAILAFLGYVCAIKYFIYKYPNEVPELLPKRQKTEYGLKAVFSLCSILLLFFVMLAGLYKGIFMQAESAAIGVAGVFAIVAASGNLSKLNWPKIFTESAKTTASIMAIFIGAEIFSVALTAFDFPKELAEYVMTYREYPLGIITIMIAALLVLGCFMDGIAIMLLIVPLFLPIVKELDLWIAPENIGIWFGIIILMVVEIGLITPPFGLNLFVIKSIEPELEQASNFKSVKYFVAAELVRMSLLVLIPGIMWCVA
ncbi:MAG: C4-dicarboxylate ABC transporter permease [Rickettsiales bacterium]|nr:MAG: C4-dicarboxylate ABC transporter permease [Rickettsiales bacterium]